MRKELTALNALHLDSTDFEQMQSQRAEIEMHITTMKGDHARTGF